jgi:deazaflavin-dependent oxidoreductase (nitroreductase family)
MSEPKAKPRLPPRWFIRLFWFTHRRLYRLTGGRLGLWRPKPNGWGAMRLNTVGRRTGLERSVMVGYFEDGPNLVTMAMNGWGEGEPAWWLNLQAHPDVRVDLADGPRLVTGQAARGEERERLWSRWRGITHFDRPIRRSRSQARTTSRLRRSFPRVNAPAIGRW